VSLRYAALTPVGGSREEPGSDPKQNQQSGAQSPLFEVFPSWESNPLSVRDGGNGDRLEAAAHVAALTKSGPACAATPCHYRERGFFELPRGGGAALNYVDRVLFCSTPYSTAPIGARPNYMLPLLSARLSSRRSAASLTVLYTPSPPSRRLDRSRAFPGTQNKAPTCRCQRRSSSSLQGEPCPAIASRRD
jgi:hypothetical protein